jgi:hypothetical protein
VPVLEIVVVRPIPATRPSVMICILLLSLMHRPVPYNILSSFLSGISFEAGLVSTTLMAVPPLPACNSSLSCPSLCPPQLFAIACCRGVGSAALQWI